MLTLWLATGIIANSQASPPEQETANFYAGGHIAALHARDEEDILTILNALICSEALE